MRGRFLAGAVAGTLAMTCTVATGAPPANDDRARAQMVTALPASTAGTTVEATREANDPFPFCGVVSSSVWYRYDAPADGRVTVALAATGDLDAVVAVYRRQRSQIAGVSCETTDARGRAGFAFAVTEGESYLVLVGQRANSAPGAFRLDLFAPEPPATLPGTRLPSTGVRSTVDPLLDPDDAWSTRLAPGVSYRVSLAPGGDRCVGLAIFAPVGDSPLRVLSCGGYRLITPGADAGGRYGLLVRAGPRREGDRPGSSRQGYRLQVSPAGPDDLAPGVELANDRPRRGRVNGRGVDRVDLYRFDVVRRSNLSLSLSGSGLEGVDLVLLGDDGRRFGTGASISRRLRPGRYLAAVRALSGGSAPYTIRRLTREITTARLLVAGGRRATVAPGATVTLSARVRPALPGPVTITVERFDPLSGWLFHRLFRTRASADGLAAVRWTPPASGRWRARASYLGTRTSSPSDTGTARLLVAAPLGSVGG